jgi:hypothetical protein
MNQHTKPIKKISKEVQSNNSCYRQIERAITLIKKKTKSISHFVGTNNTFG